MAIAFCIAIVWKASEFIVLLGTGIPAIVGVIVVVYVLFHVCNFWGLEDEYEVSTGQCLAMTLVTMGLDFPILAFFVFYLPLMSSQMGEAYIDDYISFFFKFIVVIAWHVIVWIGGWGLSHMFLRK